MLLEHVARGEHHTVRVVARVAGKQHSRLDPRLTGKVRLRRRKRLLDILWIRDEIRYAHRCGNFVNVVQLKTLGYKFEPGGPGNHGYCVAVEVGEGVDWRVLAHHDALRIALHRSGHGNQRLAAVDSL